QRLEVKEKRKIQSVSLSKYNVKPQNSTSKDRLAVVYAVGEIVSGEGGSDQIGSEKISRAIRTAREDDKVKAVVLRVNSPGGSALASDVIWREVLLTKKVKPIIVSMGDMAASGGYYIAAPADSIFAQPNTITGSIGVFGIIPNFQKFFNDKLGITFDVVKTGEFSDLGSLDRPLTAQEEAIFQQSVNKMYYSFTQKVADGRKKERSYIDSIGQGRVWTGEQALKLGLVDRLGGIEDAIASAAKTAGIDDYKLVSYPALDDPFKSLLGSSGEKLSLWFTKKELGAAYPVYQQVKETMQQSGIQARIPHTIHIKYSTMTNKVIARELKRYAQLMEFHGQNTFKIKAANSSAEIIGKLPFDVASKSTDELSTVSGIGKSTALKIQELIQNGTIAELAALEAQTSAGVLELLKIKGLGPKKIALIWNELGIDTIPEIWYACKENKIAGLKGFG